MIWIWWRVYGGEEQDVMVQLNPTNMNAIVFRCSSLLRNQYKPSGLNSIRIYSPATRLVSSMSQPVRPRRFAPLDPAKRMDGDERPLLKGIVFDVDGTLCKLSNGVCDT